VENAQVAVSNKVVLDRSILGSTQSLRLVCIAATGTNNIDLDAAREFGISVANVTGYASPSVAQHVFALILALATRLPDYQRLIANGRWQISEHFCLLDFPIWRLQGKTLGIVGYGELGRAVARIAEAFGMQILVSQRPGGAERPGRVPLDELLAAVDVLSLHCPLTESTRNLIGARELAMMKPTALLINTARGGIVDEQALAEALKAGRIGGAGVDVLTSEPPRQGNPLLHPDIPNLIVTPHIAWASLETRQHLIDEVAKNIAAFMRGESRNRIV
jgi:glycerate dehydrogenase